MSNSISTASKIPKDRQANPTRMERHASNVLHLANRYGSGNRAVRAGCDLFRLGERGEAIYSLVDGWVALYTLREDGRRQILQFALPGAVLAFVPTRGAVMNYSAQALTDGVICVVSHEKLGCLSRDCPEIGMRLASLISQDRSLAYENLSSVGRCSARERVAHLLLELYMRSRMRWPGYHSEEMDLPLTQEHIGDATGLTSVHVNRMLRDLRKEGIVEFHSRRLRILNPDKLVDVAGIEPQVALSWINDDSSDETVTDLRNRRDVTTPVHLDTIRRRTLHPTSRGL